MLTLLELSSSLECTTKPSSFPLWGEKVVVLASWGGLLISRKGAPTEVLSPNPGVLIHNWRINSFLNGLLSADFSPLEDRIDFGGHGLVDATLTTSLMALSRPNRPQVHQGAARWSEKYLSSPILGNLVQSAMSPYP